MFWIYRVVTGKLVERRVPEDLLDLVLTTLRSGVYRIEDEDGNEINVAKVRNGCVEYRDCYGPRPYVEAGAVVTFA